MISPAIAARAAPIFYDGKYCPPLVLVPPVSAGQRACIAPRSFTVQISPLIHRSLPLPPGLDEVDAEQYVRTYAQVNGYDCCVDRDGSRTVYFLSNGAQFEADV